MLLLYIFRQMCLFKLNYNIAKCVLPYFNEGIGSQGSLFAILRLNQNTHYNTHIYMYTLDSFIHHSHALWDNARAVVRSVLPIHTSIFHSSSLLMHKPPASQRHRQLAHSACLYYTVRAVSGKRIPHATTAPQRQQYIVHITPQNLVEYYMLDPS